MASQSFNLIGQDEEQELVAFDTRQSRGPIPQSRPNSRMEEMLSQVLKSQDAFVKSQEATAKSLENRIAEATKSQDATAKSLENRIAENVRDLGAKVSELVQSHTSTDDKLSQIAYTQIEQIAEMSDLVDRLSTVERSLHSSPSIGSDPTQGSLAPLGYALMASAPYPLSST